MGVPARPAAGVSLFFVLVVAVSCREAAVPPRPVERPRAVVKHVVHSLRFPFGAETVAPAITADAEDAILVSWIDTRTSALNIARWRDGQWFQPRTIARGDLSFNKANAPALLASRGATIAAWTERAGAGHGDLVRISRSNDGAATWSEPVTPHPPVKGEFGFVAFSAESDGAFGAVWLDGRNSEGKEEGEADTQLRYAKIDADGNIASEELLDGRVCDCCQTSMASTSDGPLVVYRDRSPEEVRDIAVVRKAGESWTKPKPLRRDGWKIAGCPVNGPRVDAAGRNVVAAWFSAPKNQPRVQVAFSTDGGAAFGNPIRIDSAPAAGHVDVAMLADGSAVVTWIEGTGGAVSIRAMRVRGEGTHGQSVEVARVPSAGSAGFPRIAISKDNVVVAWSGDTAGVQLALVHIPDL